MLFVRRHFFIFPTPFRLSWRPLACTSSSMADKVAVNKLLSGLGASKMSNVWSDDVTHLLMDEIILTIKAMNALAKGVPIVEPRYFSDLLSAVETKQSLPGKCSLSYSRSRVRLDARNMLLGSTVLLLFSRNFLFLLAN